MIPKILSRLVTATLLALTVATHLHAETVTVRGLEVYRPARRPLGRDSAASRARTRRGTDPSYSSRTWASSSRQSSTRAAGTLTITSSTPLRLSDGSAPGSALSQRGGARHLGDGTHAISFEGRHRVAKIHGPGNWRIRRGNPREDVSTRTNTGAEALAVDVGDTLWVISELAAGGGYDVATLRDGAWSYRGKLMGDPDFNPVGADFARGANSTSSSAPSSTWASPPACAGLATRDASLEAETVWQSPRMRHDNLEAVAVISQTAGRRRSCWSRTTTTSRCRGRRPSCSR